MYLQKQESFEGISRLSISNTNKFNSVYEIVKYLRKFPNLQSLSINLKKVRENFKELCFYIEKAESLVSITLDLSQTHQTSEKITEFAQQLSKCKQISYLSLNFFNNNAQAEGMDSLFRELSTIYNLKSLIIELASNKIQVQENEVLLSQSYRFNNLEILSINLSDNQICNQQLNNLLELIQTIPQLKQLSLILMCLGITEQQMKLISSQISKINSDQLQKIMIDLTSNLIGYNTKYNEISEEVKIISPVSSISLNLTNNSINNNNIYILTDFFQFYLNLTDLQLYLDGNSLVEFGPIILQQLLRFQNLNNLYLSLGNQKISGKSFMNLLINLLSNFRLQKLQVQLSWNNLESPDEDRFYELPQQFITLKELILEFEFNFIQEQFNSLLIEVISNNTNLQNLTFVNSESQFQLTNQALNSLSKLDNLVTFNLILQDLSGISNMQQIKKQFQKLKRLTLLTIANY